MNEGHLTDEVSAHSVRRRTLLRASVIGGAGLAAAALVGCGGDDEDASAPADATGTRQAAADPRYPKDPNLPYAYNFPEPDKQPKAGGIMRVAATWDVATMDPTKSAAG